ncbi:uncharacterized protein LOC130293588 isoform X2 [Hyla sarda]|uniref:uncharacterized protein LOC130293588 isoform X2 n=1 Tax=Hyla sarda TaxID=327740 RepID=UPI0024C36C52|nr:uncharacterized protein LOC130293588 isoform X2 [Hyla sarda]
MSEKAAGGRSDLFISAALSSASLKSKMTLIHSKISVKRSSRTETAGDHCRCAPPCSLGSGRTVRRILAACLVSLITLLGSVSIDLHDCIKEWRNTRIALQAFSSCTVLTAIRFLELLRDQRKFCCWDDFNSTDIHTILVRKMHLLCGESQELHHEDLRCLEEANVRPVCDLFLDKVIVKLVNQSDVGHLFSMVTDQLFGDLSESVNLNMVKKNPEWADMLSLHLLMRVTEDLHLMDHSSPLPSPDLSPFLYQVTMKLNYALFLSDTMKTCWAHNNNMSVYLGHFQDVSFVRPLCTNSSRCANPGLSTGLTSIQKCLFWEGFEKLRNKSKETLSTLSLKVTLLSVSCLIYPIVLVSFKQMTEWIQNYARSLKERTEDLKKERRLAEDLLHQMLPKSVAKQLRKNKHVEAESFDQVTIFFSDIVGFTSISASCTPLQVVEMLNNLYICFDSRIESYNVYKVETIGDAYMVVSGLPERNDGKHADEIAKMSLDLVAAVRQVIIPHMPSERLQLRVGIHTDQCPCLYLVAQKIHISSATYQVLLIDNAYEIEPRGEIEVKGKGKMKTYWLIGNKNYSVQNDSLVCHWNPEISRRKKMESSLGSGLQSLSSNIPSDTSRVNTPRIQEELSIQDGGTGPQTSSPKTEETMTGNEPQSKFPTLELVVPVRSDLESPRRSTLEKTVVLPGFVEESL